MTSTSKPGRPGMGLRGAGLRVAACLATISVVQACGDGQQLTVPNRVLDRPTDIALACASFTRVEGQSSVSLSMLGANQCDFTAFKNRETCDVSGLTSETRRGLGFVVNSDRNELAVFRTCAEDAMVDLDPDAPGYNFVPVGQRPEHVVVSRDSCVAVTANIGSCDLSAVTVPAVAARAHGMQSDVPPSAWSSRVVPRRADGAALGARPGAIVAVPTEFLPSVVVDSDESGSDDGEEAASGAVVDTCLDRARTVYATFPSCQLVAEVDIRTGAILQARQLVREGDGSVTVIDPGPEFVCPTDCPEQLEDGRPAVQVDPNGVFPAAIALAHPRDYWAGSEPDPNAPEENEIGYSALFVGGTGDDRVFEIPMSDDGVWADPEDIQALELQGAGGVHGIRPTPPMNLDRSLLSAGESAVHQFLYVVAGDGSTHVVARSFDEDELGVECDTQVRSSEARACVPIDPSQPLTPERNPLAQGPGIRAPGGAAITDWVFLRDSGLNPATSSLPLGFATTSAGALFVAHFGQKSGLKGEDIPGALLQTQLPPHSLIPTADPWATATPDPGPLPTMVDLAPSRGLGASTELPARLAPDIRRVDAAYVTCGFDESGDSVVTGYDNADGMAEGPVCAQLEDTIYDNDVVRGAVLDYRAFAPGEWRLSWEGAIPGVRSRTGSLVCEGELSQWPAEPGEAAGGAYCLPDVGNGRSDARLVDDGATFCDRGVLAGDKLRLLGCAADQDCGLGRVCLTASGAERGICIPESEFAEDADLWEARCAEFLTDPCDEPGNEYRIVRATQESLELQALSRPKRSHIRDLFVAPSGRVGPFATRTDCSDDVDCPTGFACTPDGGGRACALRCAQDTDCPAPTSCGTDGLCDGGVLSPDDDGARLRVEEEARYTCLMPEDAEEPEGGCETDLECSAQSLFGGDRSMGAAADAYRCIDSRCRVDCRVLEGLSDAERRAFSDDVRVELARACTLDRIPGPLCFEGLTGYEARVGESFTVTRGGRFFSEGVRAAPDGTCVRDETVDPLLTSRLPLGPTAEATFSDEGGIANCVNAATVEFGDANPCRVTTPRPEGPAEEALFHQLQVGAAFVDAVRFANPSVAFVIDLVSVLELRAADAAVDGIPVYLSPDIARFRRSRIARGYEILFGASGGYLPLAGVPQVVSLQMVFPRRIIHAPGTQNAGSMFVVDSGGRGGIEGVRGQIQRVRADRDNGIVADQNFLAR